MTTDKLTEQLIRLANEIGGNTEFSRAGGGNASVKINGILHIKPSGVPLATLKADDLVPLRIDVLLDALHSDEPVEGDPVRAAAERAQVGEAGGRRPSVEILFHALLPEPLVLHLHPLTANAVTCNHAGPQLAREILGDQAVWVDYIDPGVPLARGVEAALNEHTARTGTSAPGLVLLGNHGIIASGNTYDEVAERIYAATSAIRAAIDAAPTPQTPTPTPLPVGDAKRVAELVRQALGAAAVSWAIDEATLTWAHAQAAPVCDGPLIPDQIVYAGSLPLVLDEALDTSDGAAVEEAVVAALGAFEAAHGRKPIVAVIPGRFVAAVGDRQAAADNALATYVDALRVAADASRLGQTRVMDARERHFIENWEAESYRKQVAAEG